MDWMMQQQAKIQCKEKSVVLTTPKGDRIKVEVKVKKQETTTVNQLNDGANKEDPVWRSSPMCFPRNCQVCHQTVTLNLLLNYYLELHP
jgi:hypothetical protein